MRIARLDRRTNAWTGLPQPADVDPARAAGVGTGRSKVAISADGIGVVTWGEGGHVFARKMFNTRRSPTRRRTSRRRTSAAASRRSPTCRSVDAEDDSSYAWVVFRQTFADGGSRTLARRQRGTAFDPPVAVDTGDEPVRDPRIDLNGRGQGLATSAGASTGQPLTALIDKRDAFRPGGRILAPSTSATVAAPAISENNLSIVAAVLAGAGTPPSVAVRPFDDGVAAARTPLLSRPELGPVDPDAGFDAASDRSGGAIVAWVQGAPGERRIVAGYFDRPPSTLPRLHRPGLLPRRDADAEVAGGVQHLGSDALRGARRRHARRPDGERPSSRCRRRSRPGRTRWQVRATDVRGQATRSKRRVLRIDGRKPLLRSATGARSASSRSACARATTRARPAGGRHGGRPRVVGRRHDDPRGASTSARRIATRAAGSR